MPTKVLCGEFGNELVEKDQNKGSLRRGTRRCIRTSNFILLNDIDLSAYSGNQFNLVANFNLSKPFTGVFDVQNHKISNFNYSNSVLVSYVGIFAYVTDPATIKNINLVNPVVNGGTASEVGILVGGGGGSGSCTSAQN